MAYSVQKNGITGKAEIVINGFENGIADSPYEGIADMRNANITSLPKQANVEFATSAVTLPPSGFTTTAFTAVSGTDIFTTASTTGFYTGMALIIVTYSGTGLTNGRTYYVGDITSTTFKLYDDPGVGLTVDVTSSSSGTFTVPTFGTPSDSVSYPGASFDSTSGLNYKYNLIMTTDGYVWQLTNLPSTNTGGTVAKNSIQFLGNTGHSTASNPATGITIFLGYLLVWMDTKIDYIAVGNLSGANPSANWHYAWKTVSSSYEGHRAISATDNAVYFCNDSYIGSIIQNAGSTFDPTSAGTYTYNTSALALPSFDKATCIAQLGTNLMVGGILNFVYPWDRVSTSFSYPIILAENYVKCIVSTNSSSYIFAGNRGRIYITNGSNVDLFKKFPDSISGTVTPYYSWGWGVYFKNQLFFSISATDNSTTVINNYAGVWAIDLDTKSLRLSNSLSYGTYSGTVPVILPMGHIFPTGQGLYIGWLNSTGGVDYTSADPYTNYETRIDTDIIPVGSFYSQLNLTSIEFKLAKPLVSGEKIKISYRTNLTESFTLIDATTTAGTISTPYTPNFKNSQWLQFRIEYSSTATTPSYVPLMEIRLRQ